MALNPQGSGEAAGGSAVSIPKEARSALVLSPHLSTNTDASCGAFLGASDPASTSYLSIAVNSTVADRVEHWRRHVAPELPAHFGVISGIELQRSTAATSEQPSTRQATDLQVRTVDSPADLTGIGIALEAFLDDWGTDDPRLAICLDSLGTVLKYSGCRRVFRFLHTLMSRLRTIDATFHTHLDPAAHESTTVHTLRGLFDATVEHQD